MESRKIILFYVVMVVSIIYLFIGAYVNDFPGNLILIVLDLLLISYFIFKLFYVNKEKDKSENETETRN